jgi:lipoprotein-releasing system permease protein
MNLNLTIAWIHISKRRKQSIVAVIGVMVGIGVYLFMNSLSDGFTVYSRKEIFKNNAHIKMYVEDPQALVLMEEVDSSAIHFLLNPQKIERKSKIYDAKGEMARIRQLPFVTQVCGQVNTAASIVKGGLEHEISLFGIQVAASDSMFLISSQMKAGALNDLSVIPNSIVLGTDLMRKLNLQLHDLVPVQCPNQSVVFCKVVGVFSSGNKSLDETKTYVSIITAQHLMGEANDFFTTLHIQVDDPDQSVEYAKMVQKTTNYKVEAWQETNADLLSGDKVRGTLMGSISITILIVAAFGIYNILNMTVMQKIDDIAILMAIGFSSKDVKRIFLAEAFMMGFVGTLSGLLLGAILIWILSNLYIGGPVGHFPIYFSAEQFVRSFVLGLVIITLAGWIPASRASKLDPVQIFRK